MAVKRLDDARALTYAGKADAVFISVSATVNEALAEIVKAAHGSKIPTLSQTGGSGDKGVVLTLAPSATEQGEAAARMVTRILNGDNPASIAPQVPKLVELVLNLKEATALGLKLSLLVGLGDPRVWAELNVASFCLLAPAVLTFAVRFVQTRTRAADLCGWNSSRSGHGRDGARR